MKTRTIAQRGFTLVEVSIILLTLSILGTIMLPQLGGFNRTARYVRAKEDLGVLCSTLKALLDDVGESALYADAGPHDPPDRATPIGLLVGNGDIPIAAGNHAAERVDWTHPFGDDFTVPTDGGDREPEFWVDTFDNHLVSNTPLDDGRHRWRGPLDAQRGFNDLFYWRGPYISDEIVADPWGNRYMANVFALHTPPEAGEKEHYASGVVCYSSGPDSGVDTDFNQPLGWKTGDDDLTAVLHAGGPM